MEKFEATPFDPDCFDLLQKRRELGNRPIRKSHARVVVRGEALNNEWWVGSQWSVTAYGLECRNGQYAIAAAKLTELDWPRHVTEKNWVDMDDFCTAWLCALALHGKSTKGARDAIKRAVLSVERDIDP